MNSRVFHARKGFTLIELLVVIAIISLLAAILFPVFGRAREKSRQSVCSSNLKQFMQAIFQYNQDYDEKMPLSVNAGNQVGPGASAASGIPEFGVHVQIMPYVKNRGLFNCPDDLGFPAGTTAKFNGSSSGTTIPGPMKVSDAWGTSYKFTKENFSIAPSAPTGGLYNWTNAAGSGSGDNFVKKSRIYVDPNDTSKGFTAPPFPMPVSFFQRPSETRVMRCYVAPWDSAANGTGSLQDNSQPYIFHDSGDMVAFADGHVKWLTSEAQLKNLCDGPTYSPIRNTPGYTGNGDGSCGAERQG
jgi:prepilin-type N-terminal cleavage/methylation domain-containing protein/prepilin-type processing-associated H-X9-DG protein